MTWPAGLRPLMGSGCSCGPWGKCPMHWQHAILGFAFPPAGPTNQEHPPHRGWRWQKQQSSPGTWPVSCSWTTPQHAHTRGCAVPGATLFPSPSAPAGGCGGGHRNGHSRWCRSLHSSHRLCPQRKQFRSVRATTHEPHHEQGSMGGGGCCDCGCCGSLRASMTSKRSPRWCRKSIKTFRPQRGCLATRCGEGTAALCISSGSGFVDALVDHKRGADPCCVA